MKRVLSLLVAAGVVTSASAQQKMPSVVETGLRDASMGQSVDKPEAPQKDRYPKSTSGLKKRTYNYVSHLAIINPAITTNNDYVDLPYMWFNNDGLGMYSNGTDTINFPSYGTVLHPQWTDLNNATVYPKGTMVIDMTKQYVVDSIYTSFYYGRPKTGSFIDTLRVVYSYGNGASSNIPLYYYASTSPSSFPMVPYGVDTLRSAALSFDLVRRTMYKPSTSTGPTLVTKDILLGPNDTGSRAWGIAAGLTVPAGNLVGATFTFRSGAPYVPYDTVFRSSSVNPNEPFKYGMIRPFLYCENLSGTDPGFATYKKGNYNAGMYNLLPETEPQSSATYAPHWAWSTSNGTKASSLQYPDVDFVVSCPTCASLSVESAERLALVGQPFPNPANNTVSLPITMKESSDVVARLIDVTGQVVAEQSVGTLAAGQARNISFNTQNLAAGIYVFNVTLNGETMGKRVVITH